MTLSFFFNFPLFLFFFFSGGMPGFAFGGMPGGMGGMRGGMGGMGGSPMKKEVCLCGYMCVFVCLCASIYMRCVCSCVFD